MKKFIGKEKLINNGDPSIKVKFGEKEFLNSVDIISNDILSRYDDKLDKIGIVGIARGGLPLLTAVSHRVGIRNISVVQIQMSNSNEKWDFGDAKWVDGFIQDDVDEYIIFEDIICYGRSTKVLIDELLKRGKKVLGVYCLVLNEEIKDNCLIDDDIDIYYTRLSCNKQWVYFFWEKGYFD